MNQRTFFRQFPEPIRVEILSSVVGCLRSTQPTSVRLDADVFQTLEDHISAHVNGLRIIDATIRDVKAVQDQLNKLDRQANCILQSGPPGKGAMWKRKLHASLTWPDDPKTEGEIARHIALDIIGLKFLVVEKMLAGQPLAAFGSASDCLARQVWTDRNLAQLCRFVTQAKIEVAQTNSEAHEAVRPAIGRLMINGKPFSFEPDPIREKRKDPKGVALAEFAKHLTLVYRWMGGNAVIHKDGTGEFAKPPTAFMSFLTSIRDTLPRPYRPTRKDALHSRARVVLEVETNLTAS